MNNSRNFCSMLVFIFLVSVFSACGGNGLANPVSALASSPTKIIQPSDTPRPTTTPTPTKTHIPPTATQIPDVIDPGTHIVGIDIKPGIYRGLAGTGLVYACHWKRMKDLIGSKDSILGYGENMGQFYIEVKGSDFALLTDCKLTRLETLPQQPEEYPQTIGPGTYLVGGEIRPGTYKGQTGSDWSCYWTRLRDVAGDLDSVIASGYGYELYYVQILPTDFAFTNDTFCDLEWVGE